MTSQGNMLLCVAQTVPLALSGEQKEETAFLMLTAIGNPINTFTQQWVSPVIRIREKPLTAMTVLHKYRGGEGSHHFSILE